MRLPGLIKFMKNEFKDRADEIITYLKTFCEFPNKKIPSKELYKIFSQRRNFDLSLEDFRRQLADLRDEYNLKQYIENFKSKKPFTLIITTTEGYGTINSRKRSVEAAKTFREARDFYYSRAKEVVENTKRYDEMYDFIYNNNEPNLFN